MGKDYSLPKVEEAVFVSDTPIAKNKAKPAVAPQITLTDVYIKNIDELGNFAANKLGFATVADRQKKVLEFVRLLDNLLKQDYKHVRICLRHLLNVIGQNKEAFISGSVHAPLFTLKKIPYGYNVGRYISTITFLTSLQENIHQAGRFVSARDLPSIFKDWRIEERDKLVMFANGFAQ